MWWGHVWFSSIWSNTQNNRYTRRRFAFGLLKESILIPESKYWVYKHTRIVHILIYSFWHLPSRQVFLLWNVPVRRHSKERWSTPVSPEQPKPTRWCCGVLRNDIEFRMGSITVICLTRGPYSVAGLKSGVRCQVTGSHLTSSWGIKHSFLSFCLFTTHINNILFTPPHYLTLDLYLKVY